MIFAQSFDVTDSCIVIDATTRSSIVLTQQTGLNSQSPNLIYSLDADKVTLLSFLINPDYLPVRIVGSGAPVSYASGALISLNSYTGTVSSVLPFLGTRAASKPVITQSNGETVFKGSFLGVFDGKGKNLAPKGATEVHMNATTGRVVNIR